MTKKLHHIGLPMLIGSVCIAGVAHAEAPGVSALIKQAEYWRAKGRHDLARQAYDRVLSIDPANAQARQGLAGGAPSTPAPAPAPVPAKTVAAPARVAVKPVAPQAAAPRPTPTIVATDRPVPVRADKGGAARAAGFDALEADKLVLAAAKFRAALASNPNDPDALGGLGLVRLRGSSFVEARDLLSRASRLGAADKWSDALAAARFYAGVDDAKAALAKGDLARAQQLAEAQAGSGYKDSDIAVGLLASVYERQNRFAEAADLYRRLGQNGGSGAQAASSALRAQANAALQAGDDVQAEQLLRQGMAAAPNDPWIAYDLAGLFKKQGRPAETDALVRQLAYSESADSLFAAALILNQNGRPSDARTIISRIATGQRTKEMRDLAASIDALAVIDGARSMAARGAQGQAVATLRQAAANPSLSADAKGALAQALLDLGDNMAAVQVAREALTAPATGAGAYQSVVRVLAGAGQDGLAHAAIQKAAGFAGQSLDGQSTVALLNATLATAQADRLRLSGQFAPAFDILQSAWNMAPGNQDILEAFARLYQAGGLQAQAMQSYRMILSAKPTDKGALIGFAESAVAAGDADAGLKAIDQAIRTHPQDHEVYMAAARIAKARGNGSQSVRYLKMARELYLRSTGSAGSIATGTNPFAGVPNAGGQSQQDMNPFRTTAAPQPGFPYAAGAAVPGYAPAPMAYPVPGMGYGGGQQPVQQGYGQPAVPMPSNYSNNAAGSNGYTAMTPASFDPSGSIAGMATGAVKQKNAKREVYAAAADNAAPGVPPYGYGGPFTSTYAPPSNDPVLNAIDQELQTAVSEGGPRVDVQTGYRSRSGETGLSKLRELSGSAQISTPFAGGRVSAKANSVVVDAGTPSGSGLARYGLYASREAEAIVAREPAGFVGEDTQHASGVALSGAYESKAVKMEVGTTPLGFAKNHITGRFEVLPRLSKNATARVWADRKPVTDSIVSYVGASTPIATTSAAEPRQRLFWGSVMRSGGGVSLSYDKNGNGVYADASYYHYDGTAVRDNNSIEVNVGGYLSAWKGENAGLTVGFNANFQNYDNNQNYFTYGHGGYFSPQSFLSVNFPIRYWSENGPLRVDVNASPGYQSYDQQGEVIYPTASGAQDVLNTLKSLSNDVRSRYDSISKTGFGLSAGGSVYYALSPNTKVGGEFNLNTFGEYKEFRSLVGIKQSIGGK